MGGGVSKHDPQLEMMIEQKQQEIKELKRLLKAKSSTVEDTSGKAIELREGQMTQSKNNSTTQVGILPSIAIKSSSTTKSKLTFTTTKPSFSSKWKEDDKNNGLVTTKRREEVSAEVYSHHSLTNYEIKIVPKSNAIRSLLWNAMKGNVLFLALHHEEHQDCIDSYFQVKASAGTTIIQQGDDGDNFYVIESGTVEVLVAHENSPPLKYGEIHQGNGFGEIALLCNTPRAATIRARSDVLLWALERSTFKAICTYHQNIRKEKAFGFLQNISVLNKLNEKELMKLASGVEWQVFLNGSTIVHEGERGEQLFIISKGEVTVEKQNDLDNSPQTLQSGDYFGEMALLHDETRQATYKATKEDVVCCVLSRDRFSAILGSLEELMRRTYPLPLNSSIPHIVEKSQYHIEIRLNELEVLQTLGCGAFGRVKLVRDRKHNQTFALKCLKKSAIVKNDLQVHVTNERKVMMMLDHPFILKLHNTFTDQRYIYFLLELSLGGEIFTHLRKLKRFNESFTRFYVASVILAFQHMHDKKIVYRDLKPENLLLDSKGYLKVVDFGLAKVVEDKTWTLCGTPDYLAPEIILNKGHGIAVDFWALGVLIFELVSGNLPFVADEPMKIYHLVLSGRYRCPSYISQNCCDLIQKLLVHDPVKRYGNMKNHIHDIIEHKWFAGFNWHALMNRELEPPIVPIIKNYLDTSNFDNVPEDVEEAAISDWSPDF